jgi:runt-related transcription factor 1
MQWDCFLLFDFTIVFQLSLSEEAVNEVKRQAVAELQRAVAAAESKACELVATERAKMEKLLLEARKQAAEEALAAVVVANQQQQQPESSESVNSLPAPSQQNVSFE